MNAKNSVISIRGLTKRFGLTVAVDGVDLEILENEFFALLGPSGCGKTTLLRLLAGFEAPDEGEILLEGQDLVQVRPNRRPINLMFQSYALFPHMSVEANISYGLEMERLPRSEIAARVAAILEQTELTALKQRRPAQLSGGQKQRVALARALVKRPRLLLLDEPLGALDKKLREQMQLELKRLQHEVGITFVVVTHDQEEALVMADRIAVMNGGQVAQVGTPRQVYERPANRFVAGFIGMMNFFAGEFVEDGVKINNGLVLRGETSEAMSKGAGVTLAVRPERIRLAYEAPSAALNGVPGQIETITYHGTDVNVHLRLDGISNSVLVRQPSWAAEGERWVPGSAIWCVWEPQHSRILVN